MARLFHFIRLSEIGTSLADHTTGFGTATLSGLAIGRIVESVRRWRTIVSKRRIITAVQRQSILPRHLGTLCLARNTFGQDFGNDGRAINKKVVGMILRQVLQPKTHSEKHFLPEATQCFR